MTWNFFGSPQNHTSQGQPKNISDVFSLISHILEDELFQENKRKAQLEAYKIGFKLLFVVIWLMAIGMFSRNVEWCAMFMLISVSLIYALVLFLSNYLLYRYEKRE